MIQYKIVSTILNLKDGAEETILSYEGQKVEEAIASISTTWDDWTRIIITIEKDAPNE